MNFIIIILELNMNFENHKKLQAICNKYILENIFEFKILKCENNCYIIIYRSEKCSWCLYTFSISGIIIFRIKTYIHEYQCMRIHHVEYKQVFIIFLIDKFLDKFKDQLSYNLSERIYRAIILWFNIRERIIIILRKLF